VVSNTGTFVPPGTVVEIESTEVRNPVVAIDPAGDYVVVYMDDAAGRLTVKAVTAAGAFRDIYTLGSADLFTTARGRTEVDRKLPDDHVLLEEHLPDHDGVSRGGLPGLRK